MRRVGFVGSAALVAALIVALLELRPRDLRDPAPLGPAPADAGVFEGGVSDEAPARGRLDAGSQGRVDIALAVAPSVRRPALLDERIDGVRTLADLDAFLVDLELAARVSGRVTLEDVQAGMAAARRLGDLIGPEQARARALAFGERMRQLKRELELRPIQLELDGLAGRIGLEKPGPRREALVQRYTAAAHRLPSLDRDAAMRRLDLLAGVRR